MDGDHRRVLEAVGRVGAARLRLVVADKGGAVVLAVLEVDAPGRNVVGWFEATVALVDVREVPDGAALVDILEVTRGATVADAVDVLELVYEFAVVDVLEIACGFEVVVVEVAYRFAVVEVLELARGFAVASGLEVAG